MQIQTEEIGTISAILDKITTMKDGGVKISFEVCPEDIGVVNRLMAKHLLNQKLFSLGIVQLLAAHENNTEGTGGY